MNPFDADYQALYARRIDDESRTSLSIISTLIRPGSDVLDVGIGGGALGERLARVHGCRVDGVTLSEVEASNAAPHYRRVVVADLNSAALGELFAGQRYDAIVCADVLEHVTHPTRVLQGCRELLAADGELLLSIPNVGYAGLIGELLAGEFRYRIEGLLDRTHVRFFTRQSLLRMLREDRWRVDLVEPVTVDLPDSEFSVCFDRLPPAVQRYLLALPDGLAYQFVVRARALPAGEASDALAAQAHAPAVGGDVPHFSALLYLDDGTGYREEDKLVARGRIGEARQRIRFELPPRSVPLLGLRLDPADRPGFLHLFGMRLLTAAGELAWAWDGRHETLARGGHQQVLFRLPWLEHEGATLLLTGEDPFFELPIDRERLARCGQGAALEVEMGWPMSADYALFVDELARRQTRIDTLLAQARGDAQRLAEQQGETRRLEQALAAQVEAQRRLQSDVDRLGSEKDALRARAAHLEDALREARREIDDARHEIDALHRQIDDARREIGSLEGRGEQQRVRYNALVRERDALQRRLDRIEQSLLFRVAAPIGRGLRRVRAAARRVPAAPGTLRLRSLEASVGVDVVVPVYKGLRETKACLDSLLASTPSTPFRVVIVNDASPEPEITGYLRALRDADARVELIENPVNAGFVASVNRGMSSGPRNDVVLLNSDTEVAGDWLDRLHAAAYRGTRVGTVTPFSNSATICSYPRDCEDNALPDGMTTAALDCLFAAENRGRSVEIPTAVGFCMYIRRDCLNAVGLFDVERFGRGYGEENDFCMRARRAGWRHMLALDTFVLHAGGVSFGAEKAPRVQEAQQTLKRMYPEYESLVQRHLAEDPAHAARLAVDLARIRDSGLPGVLFVSHFGGGGTERHVRELAALLQRRANPFLLRPTHHGETILEWLRPGEGMRLAFRLDEDLDALVAALKAVNVNHIHYHHTQGHSPSIWGLASRLNVAHDFTVHDFYAVCPQISMTDPAGRYCGEAGISRCDECLQRRPAPGAVSIATWRAGFQPLLESARHVFAPSADAAARIGRYFPSVRLVHAPHLDLPVSPPVAVPAAIAADGALRIVVVGALSAIKGADTLEQVAIEAARRDLPLEFHLLGFGYRALKTQPRARLTVHGAYEEPDLPKLLEWLKPDLAWFPARWPETYSYTLSACLAARLPIVAPDLGAFSERLRGRPWTWLCPWDRSAADWSEFFVRIRREHFCTGSAPATAVATPDASGALSFSYERDYLAESVASVEPPVLSPEFLERHRPGRSIPAEGQRARRALLRLARRVRRAPVIGTLAARVPGGMQARLRAWLKP